VDIAVTSGGPWHSLRLSCGSEYSLGLSSMSVFPLLGLGLSAALDGVLFA
jgi:hypothetical protein